MDRRNSAENRREMYQSKLKNEEPFTTTQTGTDQSMCSRETHKNKYNSAAGDINNTVMFEKINSLPTSDIKQVDCSNSSSINSSQESSSITFDSGYQSDQSSFKSIGHQVGSGQLDIITKLAEVEPGLVRTIIEFIGNRDLQHLISFSKVSSEWHSILETTSPAEAAKVYNYQKEKQQERLMHKENNLKGKPDKRSLTESELPLTIVQEIGKPQSSSTPKTSRPNSAMGLHKQYFEAGQQLFADESLTKCARSGCVFPAKHLLHNQKGLCTNHHCQFEFCTNCRCEFHGGEPCKVFKEKGPSLSKKRGGGVGSKRSKNNLNRIGKL